MLIIGHRGYRKAYAGNTIPAFQAAIDLGVDGLETDLRITRDDKLILFHDRNIDDMLVKELTYDELTAAVGRPVPLARDALDRMDGVLWNLEIKTPAAVDASLELIKDCLGRRKLLVTSFWHPTVERIRSELEVDCGAIISNRPLHNLDFQRFPDFGIETIVWNYECVDDDTLSRSGAAGITNLTYNVRVRSEHQDAISRDFAGVITDHPEYCV